MRRVLGIDPGFASVGFAVVQLEADTTPDVMSMGVIRTEKWKPQKPKKGQKALKQQKPSASEDNLRRAVEIYEHLDGLMRYHEVEALCVESMSFPRNASAASKMAMCWGVIAALSVRFGVPVIQVTPKWIKLSVTGNPKAEKNEVQEALNEILGVLETDGTGIDAVPRSLREHPYDALGAVVATLPTDEMKTLLMKGDG